MTALYDTDFVAWAHEQAGLARAGSVRSLDLANIAEELESMVRAERRTLASQIQRLIATIRADAAGVLRLGTFPA